MHPVVCNCFFFFKGRWGSVNKSIRLCSSYACLPEQDNVGLLHCPNIVLDDDFNGLSIKFLLKTLRAFFALYAGDEARWQRGVITVCDGGGGGSGSVRLPFWLAV